MNRPIPLMIEVDTTDYYQGWDVSINGVPIYHKPYDGSDDEKAAEEFLTVLGKLMRRETGYPEHAPGEEGDDDA